MSVACNPFFRTLRFLAPTLTLLLVACGGGGSDVTPPPPPPTTVATVTVSLASSSIQSGQTTQASATLRSSSGAELAGRSVSWTSSSIAVATISQSGLISAVAPGSTTITATSEGRSGTATLVVTAVPVATVTLESDSIDVPLRASHQLVATLKDAGGSILSGRTVGWQVAPTATASISGTGLLRMLQPGVVTVTATSEGRTASIRVRGSVVDLATIVDSVRGAYGLPAMGGAIVMRDGLVGIGVAGSRRIGGGQPATIADKWHIGSNTKAVTGVLAGIAVQEGLIDWSTTISAMFPELIASMRAEYQDVTLRELLSHTGGITNSEDGLPATADTRAARLSWTSYTLQQPPQNARGVYFYSNNGFGIVGAMLDRALNSRYEDALSLRLFTPLALANVGWGPTTGVGGMDQPVGHRWTSGAWVACEACDNLPGLSSAGTMHLPLESWARLVQELLLADQARSDILTQQTARYLTSDALPSGSPLSYGMGWVTGGAPNNRYATHDGSNTTNHSRAIMYLDAGVAFLVTINASDGATTGPALNVLQQRLDEYWTSGR